ncbi:MAG: hypothetical protein PVJ27_12110 [Candidatus Brocadiaceae bacterium]|jgi:hypothetical protein
MPAGAGPCLPGAPLPRGVFADWPKPDRRAPTRGRPGVADFVRPVEGGNAAGRSIVEGLRSDPERAASRNARGAGPDGPAGAHP